MAGGALLAALGFLPPGLLWNERVGAVVWRSHGKTDRPLGHGGLAQYVGGQTFLVECVLF